MGTNRHICVTQLLYIRETKKIRKPPITSYDTRDNIKKYIFYFHRHKRKSRNCTDDRLGGNWEPNAIANSATDSRNVFKSLSKLTSNSNISGHRSP